MYRMLPWDFGDRDVPPKNRSIPIYWKTMHGVCEHKRILARIDRKAKWALNHLKARCKDIKSHERDSLQTRNNADDDALIKDGSGSV